MWFFQHKKLFNVFDTFGVVCISVSLHFFLLILIFFFYRTADEPMVIKVDRLMGQNIDLVLLRPSLTPALLKNKGANNVGAGELKSGHIKKTGVPVPQKKATLSKQQNTMITPSSVVSQKAVAKKLPIKKIEKKEVIKKELPTKKIPIPVKQTRIEKVPEKTEPIQAAISADKVAEVSTPLVKDIAKETVYVTPQELEIVKRKDFLETELAKVWHPPQLQMSDPECIIEVGINQNGIIERLEIVQSSGMLMYDIAAKKAVSDIVMPTWAYGKSMTIILKA